VDIRIPTPFEISTAVLAHRLNSFDDRTKQRELQIENNGEKTLKWGDLRKYAGVDIAANILQREI
jgi:hypothetical protein